jgi:4-hydroxy-2-oxoheptanedioate aldolase
LAPGFDREEPEMVETIKKILTEAKTLGLRAGIHCGSSAYAVRAINWGFDFTTISNDVRVLVSGASKMVAETRGLLEGTDLNVKSDAEKSGY